MKIVIKLSVFTILTAILFTACQKDNYDEIISEDPVYEVDTITVNPFIASLGSFSADTIYIGCVKISLPVDFLQESGNIITVNSSAELDSFSMLTDSIVDFIYPFEALVDSDVFQIEAIEDLAYAIQSCESTVVDCSDLDAHVLLFFNGLNILTLNRYVYDINYPVTLIVEGNQVVINSDGEYLPAIGGSPFNYLETELVYPITVTQFGLDIVLNSDADVCAFYYTLDEDCQNKPAHIQFFFNEGPGTAINCTYFINYPLNITLNGSTIQIQSRNEYLNILNSSSNAYDAIELGYPVSVQKFIGSQDLVFESDTEICDYLDNCN